MLRRLFMLALLFTCQWPQLGLAARLELRPATTDQDPGLLLVGDEIDVEIWVDSENLPLSGAAVFLSFDPNYFALVETDRQPSQGGFQPFLPGSFLDNGETFRNDLLAEDEPGGNLNGIQLDYSVVRAQDEGLGVLATFRLKALAPTRHSAVRIDENGLRETRVFKPDGTQAPFRFIAPLNLAIQGITINGLPRQLVLARGQIDSTSFQLKDLVFDPLHDVDAIQWQVSQAGVLEVYLNPQTHTVTLNAPTDASSWEQLIFTATNPDGQSTSDTVDVFVNAAPSLAPTQSIRFAEDQPYPIQLEALATDPDTPIDQLDWTFTTSPEMAITVSGPPYQATFIPQANWHGETTVQIQVSDNFGFSDSAQVSVTVTPVNDPPRLPAAPNIRLTAGKTDSSLTLENLIEDPDDGLESLLFSWSRTEHISIENSGGRLRLSAGLGWQGSEEILLRVEDPSGQSATAPLTVLVIASLPPSLIAPPTRLGLTAGDHLVLDLQRLAVDPDDQADDLQWNISGQINLRVQLNGHAARIEAPEGFSGTEVLSFTVADPSGSEASFEVLFFAAAANGAPTFARLPQITLSLAGIDTSIDLDDFVFDPDHRADQLEWLSPQHDDISIRIDPETRILTLSPTAAALPGPINLELRLRDPDGHEAVQTLSIILLGDTPEPSFTLATIADIELTNDQTFNLALDTLVEGELPPDQLQWHIDAPPGIIIEFDASTRTVQLRRTDPFPAETTITFTATAPDGQILSRRATMLGIDSPPDITLSLETLPVLRVEAGSFDNSIDLDQFIRGTDTNAITWEVERQEHTRVLIDPQTHVIVVIADEDWSGKEILILKGRDAQGRTVEGILQVQILAAVAPLSLNETFETNLFVGDTKLALPLDQLLTSDVSIADLTWQADGDQPLETTYDPVTHTINLQTPVPWQSDDIIRLTAIDSDGNRATMHILVHALSLDGSTGRTTPKFRLAVVPNVLQPDFLDLFVLSDTLLASTPRLRLRETTWSDLTLDVHASGIWYSRHVLRPGQDGNFTFMAFGLDEQRQALKTEINLFVGTIAKRRAKRLKINNLSVYIPADAFGEDALVAVLPTAMPPVGQELIARSPAYTLHSPQSYHGIGGTISISASDDEDGHLGIYRWDSMQQLWEFSGAGQNNGEVQAPLLELGLYALFSDRSPPEILATENTPDHSRFLWVDQGSGLGSVTLYMDGILLPDSAYSWKDEWLELNTRYLTSGKHTIRLHVSDRAGNQTTLEKTVLVQNNQPQALSLGQNFPNPFNPSTTIPLFIAAPNATPVHLDIYNTAGQRVRRLLNQALAPGAHRIVWDARDDSGRPLASGTYLYRLEVNGNLLARKLNLMR